MHTDGMEMVMDATDRKSALKTLNEMSQIITESKWRGRMIDCFFIGLTLGFAIGVGIIMAILITR